MIISQKSGLLCARGCNRSVVFRCKKRAPPSRRIVHLDTKTGSTNKLVSEKLLAESSASNAEKEALEFLAERGQALGLNLTKSERKVIATEVLENKGRLCRSDWENIVSRRFFADQERLTFSDYIAKSHDAHIGQHMLKWTARLGVAFFALTGAHTAGEAGMHVFGSTLVGCVTSLGGGTLNDFITGAPVRWVKAPSFLVITIGASVVGFYVWPLVERLMLVNDTETERSSDDTATNNKLEAAAIDIDDGPTALRYTLESVALGALAVVGAQQGIVRGLQPLVSSALGVTIAFGGVLRDLMCQRDLSLGAATGCQSYGIASFSGASVYVALRQLHVWNCDGSTSKLIHGGIPIGLRIVIGVGTVLGIRAFAWQYKPDGILLDMEESAVSNEKRIQGLVSTLRNPKE